MGEASVPSLPRLLVADDEPSIVRSIALFFQSRQYVIDTAADRQSAVKLLAERAYAAVLTDLRFGASADHDGLEIVRVARLANPRAAIVLVTAFPGADLDRLATERGADAIVIKPCSLRELEAQIVDALTRRRQPEFTFVTPLPEESAVPKKKILVVDDSATALMMTQMILRRGPYEFLTAHDGRQAVDVATASRPDLILMDLVMPHMTGLEACRTLRERDETRTTPIIMITTRSESEHVAAGLESGCTDYVTKPIDGVELLAKVKNYLGE